MPRTRMVISRLWLQVAVVTFLVGFTILGLLAASVARSAPPIPRQVVDERGRPLFTANDIMAGQHLFQRYGLMQFGTVFGHGAYLGPDFGARHLRLEALEMQRFYGGTPATTPLDAARPFAVPPQATPAVAARVERELKANTYDPASGALTYTAARRHAVERLTAFYADWFGAEVRQRGLRRPAVTRPDEIHQLTAYFSWVAWVSAATRPGTSHSYTNNWPPEPLAGNSPTSEAFLWSVLSLIALLGGIGVVLFAFGRFDILGWRRAVDEEPDREVTFRAPEDVSLTPAQRATAWYFLVVAGLFLCQGLLGGVNAHYHVEPHGFYGLNLASLLPYNLSRTWHVQLAIFFVASAYLAMGIFMAPLIARTEPRHQAKLAFVLFGALVVVVLGSLAGEAISIKGLMSRSDPWFWVGMQGWEYLDLGRLWQIALTAGLFLWVAILVRGLRRRLGGEHPGNLPYLFLYSALSIPVFYAVGMAFGKNANFAVMDFWRFWVVHLWVEDFLELFTTIMVAYMFVLLGVVRPTTATRVVYLDIILYSVGGVVGTMHHLYFSGAPAIHMSLGAFFSAMEVIPLVLLTVEAWRFMRLGSRRAEDPQLRTLARGFPHRWAVMFLIAVGFWNFLGAGVFGFLINLPIVSYYEIGTQFTANHAHGAMMGVYGMLAIGFFMFVARYFIPPDRRSEAAMRLSFWSLNLGLAWMLFVNLVPLGLLQLKDSFQNGYWHARELDFFLRPDVRVIEWLRLPGDVAFILGGILPVVYLGVRMFRERRRYATLPAEARTDELTHAQPG